MAKLETIPAPVTIFLEDLHQLEPTGESRSLVFQLMRLTAVTCKFIITSRTPVQELDIWSLRGQALVIEDKSLAFSLEETLALSARRWQATNEELAILLADLTNGWPLAISSFLTTVPAARADHFTRDLRILLQRCFTTLVAELPPAIAHLLYRLSQSNQFSREIIVEQHTADPAADIISRLGELVYHDGAGNFRIQKELRQYLRAQSPKHLKPEEITFIRQSNIETAIAAGRLVDALEDLTTPVDIEALEAFLIAYGDKIPGYRWPAASKLLHRISPATRLTKPYIALFFGRFLGEVSPAKAVEPIRAAIDMFVKANDIPGELKSSIYLLELQITIAQGLKLQTVSNRVIELAPEYGQFLSQSDQVLLYTVLGGHAVYNLGDNQSVKSLLDRAEMLNASASDDFTFRLLALRAIDHIFHQRASSALAQVEALQKINRNFISRSDQLLMYVVRATYLAMTGDAVRLTAVLQEAQETVDEQLLVQSQSGGILKLLEADIQQLAGNISGAVAVLTNASSDFYFVAEGAVKSQWFGYMAHTLAIAGRSGEAKIHASQIGVMTPHPVSIMRMQMVNASIQVMSGQYAAAQQMLTEVLAMGDGYPHFKIAAQGLMFLSLRHIDTTKAQLHLTDWVRGVCAEDYPRIILVGFSHQTLSELIKAGGLIAGNDRYFDVARQIAKLYLGKALSSAYDTIPFLSVTTGTGIISLKDTQLEMTKQQKRAIYLASLMPDHVIMLEDLAERLWPDTPNPESRLYKMLSRLRKVFVDAGYDPADYIRQIPGQFALINIKLDVHEYQMLSSKSIELRNAGYHWSATTTALSALEAWTGVFSTTLQSMNLPLEGYEQQYDQTCLNLLDHVLPSTTKTKRLIAALLRRHFADPSNVSTASTLATLFRASDDLLSLVHLRQRVEEALHDIDLAETDIQLELAAL